MKKIKFLPLILIFCLVLAGFAPSAYALDDPAVTGNAIILADADTGRILYSKNMNTQVHPASLTKMMTILIATEMVERGERSMDDEVTAPSDCRIGMDEDSSTAGIQPGEVLTYGDLMYCALLQSANEACNCLAVNISGSISEFVGRMNQRAEELGMNSTHFNNTNGLTDSNHYTTAYDFYLLSLEVMRHSLFMAIANTATYTVPATRFSPERTLANSNALISSGSIYGGNYLYPYASGIKTGYTRAAGYCLTSTAEMDGVRLLSVIMGCEGPNNSSRTDHGNFVDAIKLYTWGFDNFAYRPVLTTSAAIARLDVAMAAGSGVAILRPQTDVTLLVPKDITDDDVRTDITIYDENPVAPIAAGTVLGEATVYINDEVYCTVKLVNNSDVELSRGEYMKQQLHNFVDHTWFKVIITILLLFFALYLALVIRYRQLRRRHLKRKKMAEQRRRAERERIRRDVQAAPGEPTRRYEVIDRDDPDGQ